MAFSRLAESSARAPRLVAATSMATEAAVAAMRINERGLALFMSILHEAARNVDAPRKARLDMDQAPLFINNGVLLIELLQPFSISQRDLPLTCLRELENALVSQMR
jgi:hypothetical protein